jgi:hypothetical protein
MQHKIISSIVMLILCFASCLPEGKETYIIKLFPDEFKEEWFIAMKCRELETDVAVLPLKIEDPRLFEASGQGIDYDSSLIQINFKGLYNPVTDSLFCIITTIDPEIDYVVRKDSFALRFDTYKGDYLDATNLFFATGITGCDVAFRFIFDKTPKSASISNFEKYNTLWIKR